MHSNTNTAVGFPPHPLDGLQLTRLRQAVEGLDSEQLAWASGYLAGLGALQPVPDQAANEAPTLTVLYATQGGNARSLAEALAERASARGLSPRLVAADRYRPRDLARERQLAVVISTQGEGEPPESALELFKFLKGGKRPKLDGLEYAVFGLGDSSYEHFNQAGRDLDALLRAAGARPLLARIDADVDYPSHAEAWRERLLDEVEKRHPAPPTRVIPLSRTPSVPRHDRDHPYRAELLERRRITTDDALSEVHHLVLGIDPAVLRYRPGDALGLRFRNDPALVGEVLERTGLPGDACVTLNGTQTTLVQALEERLELTRLHPAVAKAWAALAGDAGLRALCAEGEPLRRLVSERQFPDLLQDYPAEVEAQRLVELLHPQQTRLYSIASSQAACGDELHLTVSALRYRVGERERRGGASGYLGRRLGEGDPIEIHVAENPGFRLPESDATPIVMIGAGTGIAPYRAFLQEREARGAPGANWLVFGNRHFHRDFLYQNDWLDYRRRGLLTRISLAFSRDEGDRAYVQARLYEEGAELYRWLQEGAHLYVCGGIAMEQAVRQSLLAVAQVQGGLDEAGAETFIETLREQGRYQRDVY